MYRLRLGFKIGREISTESYSKWKNEIIQRRELLRKRLFAFFNDSVFSSGSNQPEGPLDRGSLSAFEYSEADLVEARGDGVIYSGNVRMRPKTGGDISTWTQCQLRLMLPSIEIRSMDGKLIVKDKLTPSSSAYETALGDYTFQLVSTRLISQISVSNASERTIWLALLREAIRESISDSSDSLFQQAVLRVDFDEIYHLDVPSVRPLGLVFERVGEWAVVQSSKLEDSTSVSEGSILCAVDNQPVLFEAYRDSVSLLRKARPPMRLSFRRSPRKEGELFKLSHQKDSKGKSSYSWKKRIFALDRGKLGYRRSGTPSSGTNAPVELSLVGARVALFLDEDENFDIPGVDPSDPDLHAFVVSSGLATVLVRCKSHKEVSLIQIYHCKL